MVEQRSPKDWEKSADRASNITLKLRWRFFFYVGRISRARNLISELIAAATVQNSRYELIISAFPTGRESSLLGSSYPPL